MNTHAEKAQERRDQSVANNISLRRGDTEAALLSVDNRPEAIRQRRLQEMADNSSRVNQFKALQEMLDARSEARPPYVGRAAPHNSSHLSRAEASAQLLKTRSTDSPLDARMSSLMQAKKLESGRLNLVGENHEESASRRDQEKQIAAQDAGGEYWTEEEFRFHPLGILDPENENEGSVQGDPRVYRIAHLLQYLKKDKTVLETYIDTAKKLEKIASVQMDKKYDIGYKPAFNHALRFFNRTIDGLEQLDDEINRLEDDAQEQEFFAEFAGTIDLIKALVPVAIKKWHGAKEKLDEIVENKHSEGLWIELRERSEDLVVEALETMINTGETEFGNADQIMQQRNMSMTTAAKVSAEKRGVWKIGNDHAQDIQSRGKPLPFNLMNRDEFYLEPAYKERLGGV